MRYEFRCPKCQNIFEEIYTLTELRNSFPTTQCPKCLAIAQRLFTPPMTVMDLTPYYDHSLGCYIQSKQERSRKMKELGVTEIGNEKPDYGAIERKKERERTKQAEEIKSEAFKVMDTIHE